MDILQYHVESEASDVTAPSPSAIPTPSFGCQGIDILTFPQDLAEGSSGRDIAGVDIPGPVASGPDDSQVLKDSSSSRESTSEAPSEDSDMSVGQPAAPKRQTRTLKGSVGKALQEKRRRQNMLGAVELCENAMQVDASSWDDASDVSVLYDMADQAVLIATSRQTELTAPTITFSAPASSTQVLACSSSSPTSTTSSSFDRHRLHSHSTS